MVELNKMQTYQNMLVYIVLFLSLVLMVQVHWNRALIEGLKSQIKAPQVQSRTRRETTEEVSSLLEELKKLKNELENAHCSTVRRCGIARGPVGPRGEKGEQGASLFQPRFQSINFPKSVLQGSNVSLSCTFQGNPVPKVSWETDFPNVHMSHSIDYDKYEATSILRVTNATASHDSSSTNIKHVKCTAKNMLGTNETRGTIEIHAKPIAHIFQTTKPLERGFEWQKGRDIYFPCSAGPGFPDANRTWQRADGRPFSSRVRVDEGILLMKGLQTEDSGEYVCRVFNYLGTSSLAIDIKAVLKFVGGEELNEDFRKVVVDKSSHKISCMTFEYASLKGRFDTYNFTVTQNEGVLTVSTTVTESGNYTCTFEDVDGDKITRVYQIYFFRIPTPYKTGYNMERLGKWLLETPEGLGDYKLCWKTSHHSRWNKKSFFRSCKNKTHTITLFKPARHEELVGAYSDIPWRADDNVNQCLSSNNSFIFDFINWKKHPIQDPTKAVCYKGGSQPYWPRFGDENLYIVDFYGKSIYQQSNSVYSQVRNQFHYADLEDVEVYYKV